MKLRYKVNIKEEFYHSKAMLCHRGKGYVSANELYLRSEGFGTRPPVADD